MIRTISILLAVLILSITAAAYRSPSGRAGSITGRVLADGQPLSFATIHAKSVGESTGDRISTTDKEGNFQFIDLSSGVYTINASSPGYVDLDADEEENRKRRYYRAGDFAVINMIKGGVITGTVTDRNGGPVIAVGVRAFRVRNIDGGPVGKIKEGNEQLTDDRGIYRLYGLRPGIYLINACNAGIFQDSSSAYEDDIPTYYPSATRAAAKEVTVRAGEEVTGIDIQYRGEPGHSISGKIESGSNSGTVNIFLIHSSTNAFEAVAEVDLDEPDRSFAFHGVPDGEYELYAVHAKEKGDKTANTHRVTVKGTDVTGVNLRLLPLGSISGRMVISIRKPDQRIACSGSREELLNDAVILAKRDEKPVLKDSSDATPNNKGEFSLKNLKEGRYRIETELPGENWYVQSITMHKSSPGDGIQLKTGEKMTGLLITLDEGAAGLRGKVLASERLKIYLVPEEREQADNWLRYMEAITESGQFRFSNIAPGRYLIIARPATKENPITWSREGRTLLRKEAEAAKTLIELPHCARIADYVLQLKN
jgi:hypothetical protein